MKHILLLPFLLFSSVCTQAELKRITVDLDYKMIRGTPFSRSTNDPTSRSRKNLKKINVFMPNLNDKLNSNDPEVICTTHTGSRLRLSPKEQAARIDTTTGETLNYLIIASGESQFKKNELESKYTLDDGRKIVTTFIDGANDGLGYYIRHGGETSPSFRCSKN